MSLSDKVVFISGASRGIGSGIARRLAVEGARVVISYSNQRERALELQKMLQADGHVAMTVEMQVQNRSSIRDALTSVKSILGPIDVLVNNAAIAQEKPFETISDADWETMFRVNLQGPFSLSQEVLPDMIEKRWGRIINITSIGGQIGGINQIHYASSKAGLIGLTKSLARVYSSHGITCNAIAPGLVSTDMAQRELDSDAGRKKIAAIPAGRIGSVEEIGDTCAFLCSEGAGYITGQTLNLNGGMYFG
jgi:NAD(P)-dependent dehydrogenase (short-subunit alcohol dehydrogenase family)